MIELAAAASLGFALVIQDRTVLRAAPRDSAQAHTLLWQGEAVEVRGERLDYLQVYDHRRERGGFVSAAQVRRFALAPEEAPELLAVLRFLHGTPGSEALGIGLAAAWLRAASAEQVNGLAGSEVLDALGVFADRLARRASAPGAQSKETQAALAAHFDVAARYGVTFLNQEIDGRVRLCYDGDAFRRVLALPSTPVQRARAALALTRSDCTSPDLHPQKRRALDEWRAEVLDRVEPNTLPATQRNRLLMRRAGVWASLAFQRARQGEIAYPAASRALAELTGVRPADLTEADRRLYRETALRVGASRWAAMAVPSATGEGAPRIVTAPGEPGETCVLLVDAKGDTRRPLARRCTYAVVWTASASLNREGTALALAVQPTEGWRELWVFRKAAAGWSVRVLPPTAATPDLGYAEFAGWVPGGAQMLVAREALAAGRHLRRFELLRLDTLAPVRQAAEPDAIGAFQRWRDPAWRQHTLSLR
jgi:hypothetical protein